MSRKNVNKLVDALVADTNVDRQESIVTLAKELGEKIEGEKVVVEVPTFDYAKSLEAHKSKSGVIRALAAEGKSCKEIYKLLKDAGVMNNEGTQAIRYQHVRNVLNTPVKKIS